VGEEQPEQPRARPLDRVQAWRDDRRVVAVVCACLALAAGVAWWRAGSSRAAVPAPATEHTVPVGSNATTSTSANAPTLIVAVVGAVHAPGVVRVGAGARVFDVIAAAGGATADADLGALNLAAPVDDGTRVAVPRRGQPAPEIDPGAVTGGSSGGSSGGGTGTGGSGGGGGASGGLVNINRATAAELEELPGVGPATAAAIISDREEHGPFPTVDDLARVRGIGPAKLEQLRDLVAI
jgi:competence protein ComEA